MGREGPWTVLSSIENQEGPPEYRRHFKRATGELSRAAFLLFLTYTEALPSPSQGRVLRNSRRERLIQNSAVASGRRRFDFAPHAIAASRPLPPSASARLAS